MTEVWVLGNGQLGAMLQHAAMPLGIKVHPTDIDAPLTELPVNAVVTAEREHWPATATSEQLFNHPGFVSRRAFNELPDRKTQKQWFDQLQLATAKWRSLDVAITGEELHNALGDRVLLKRRTGGYDGKGQFWLRRDDTAVPSDWRGKAIAEEAVAFSEEASIIGVRNAEGHCEFYPLTLNLHMDGILMASIAPAPGLEALQQQAEAMLGSLMQALDYVGVMAMECFLVGDQLVINEVAPRVHNSGHWTQAGNCISQFELHLRAVTGLPLAKPLVKNTSVMINLIGTERDNRWLAVPGAELYWYNKEVRSGRKLGHINLSPAKQSDLNKALQALTGLLPPNYAAAIDWIRNHL